MQEKFLSNTIPTNEVIQPVAPMSDDQFSDTDKNLKFFPEVDINGKHLSIDTAIASASYKSTIHGDCYGALNSLSDQISEKSKEYESYGISIVGGKLRKTDRRTGKYSEIPISLEDSKILIKIKKWLVD